MSLDLQELHAAVEAHGRVARIVIAGHQGSSPREAGAAMLVWDVGQSGTIGGGALEWQATQTARRMLASGGTRVERAALGPSLGQCCGGAVTLVFEVFDPPRLASIGDGQDDVSGRPVAPDAAPNPPMAVKRLAARARRGEGIAGARLVEGWLVEPFARPERKLWVWGAGHVGRAVVATAAPLPGFAITWVDCAAARFPETMPERVTPLVAANPADLVTAAPPGAEHLILTYSHALDLELCHRLLGHHFAALGLIGSHSKWARFCTRLRGLGHNDAQISRITCPIGRPELGKHPQAIAVGVVAGLLAERHAAARTGEQAG